MEKLFCILLNFILPGVGTLVLKRTLNGSLQLALSLFSILLILTVWLTFYGLVLYAFVWLWALIEAILIKDAESSNPTPQ
ncbi:hypothetical protein [Cohaesibacter gelatinilyticus]|uniref:Uncharacterized protein n=1 Tax=Cohaesibacter gelatinilyticus TaxID=372072 RepID=A0A285NGU9_9HYPH|nr:hypothetical protein [Cohaesibacter gelatinilyticus]SNZ08669.1 hypothetical protein SAMN06265368_1765 [Cohaesibacter gelatinilyticus]HAT84991.1 hypothetical protein [Hyphomicrobiales bacterium]